MSWLFFVFIWVSGAQTCAPLPATITRQFRGAVGSTLDGITDLDRRDGAGEFAIPGDRALALRRLTTAALVAADTDGAALRLDNCLSSGPRDGTCLNPMNDYLRAGYGLWTILTRAIDCGEVEESRRPSLSQALGDVELQLKAVVEHTIRALVESGANEVPKLEATCAALKMRLQFERDQRALRQLIGEADAVGASVIRNLEDFAAGTCQ